MSDTATETESQDQLAGAVGRLREAVEGMAANAVSEESVRRIAEEVVQASADARRSGYTPPDVDPDVEQRGRFSSDPNTRAREIHGTSAREAARILDRDVEDVRHFHESADRLLILAAARGVSPAATSFYENDYLPALRAMDTQTAGEGAEYVPTNLSSSLIERVSLELMVLNLFPTVPMPTNPFDIPGRAFNRQRGGRHPEQVADSGQTLIKKITPATRKIRLAAQRFAAEVLISKDEEEDAIIAMMPFLEEEIVDYLAFDKEDTAINGDTAVTHRDSDVTLANDPRKNWDGLRKHAAAAGTQRDNGAVKLTLAGLRAQRGSMGKYGVRVNNLAHVLGVKSYIDVLADPTVQTVDKYGPNATVITGELGRADGVPIVLSEGVREDLGAAGVYAAASTKTVALTVYTKGFVRGVRRNTTVQLLKELYAEADQDGIIVTEREAFASRYPGEPVVAASYNIAPGV